MHITIMIFLFRTQKWKFSYLLYKAARQICVDEMNIDSVGKIRPPRAGEGQTSLLITDNTRVHAKQGGVSHKWVWWLKFSLWTSSLFHSKYHVLFCFDHIHSLLRFLVVDWTIRHHEHPFIHREYTDLKCWYIFWYSSLWVWHWYSPDWNLGTFALEYNRWKAIIL